MKSSRDRERMRWRREQKFLLFLMEIEWPIPAAVKLLERCSIDVKFMGRYLHAITRRQSRISTHLIMRDFF